MDINYLRTRLDSKTVCHHPWEHYIIENILDTDTVNRLNACGRNPIKYFKGQTIECDLTMEIYNAFNSINIKSFFNQFADVSNLEPVFQITRHGADYKYPIHIDMEPKIVSLIIYIGHDHPESDGTHLHSSANGGIVSTIPFKNNLGMFFISSPEKFHSYGPFALERNALVLNYWSD